MHFLHTGVAMLQPYAEAHIDILCNAACMSMFCICLERKSRNRLWQTCCANPVLNSMQSLYIVTPVFNASVQPITADCCSQ